MRYIYQGHTKDANGRIIQEATVSVYLAGTTTAASVYAAESGGAAVNSVESDDNGQFSFWVDTADYAVTQKFKITITKAVSSVAAYEPSTVDNIVIMTYYNDQYRTVWIPASFMTPTTTAGCAALATNEYATNDINMDYLAFDGATEENAEFQFAMPEHWDLGTIKAKAFWSSASGSTAGDTVEWEIAAGALSNNDTIDAALGTAQVISDVLLADNGTKLQTTAATPAITVGGTPALGDLIHFKVSRNVGGTDNMTEDAWLFGVWIQFHEDVTVVAW